MSNRRVSTTVDVLLLAIVLLSLLVLVLPSASARAETKVDFPDANIRATIGQAINKPTGDIYQSDLADVSSLTAENKDVSDLSGLKYCTSLTSLDLSGNQIGNISSLSGLSDLSGLGSMLNQTGNISSLSSLSDLSGLNLSRNQISDISPRSTPAPAGKKNIWLIVGPIAMVTVIALLVDRFLTLRGRKPPVPPTPTTGPK
jgi:Leucine-rich repeat (LRR) protein